MLWNALDKNTRGDSPKRKYKSVVLSVVTDEEIPLFEQGKSIGQIRKQIIARMMNETYNQGGILSTRDVGLILSTGSETVSKARMEYEKETQTVLPHPGVLHDMGSTVTHKNIIVYKHVAEKKATNIVAIETNHSQRAVDHYISDYNRVKSLIEDNKTWSSFTWLPKLPSLLSNNIKLFLINVSKKVKLCFSLLIYLQSHLTLSNGVARPGRFISSIDMNVLPTI